MVSLAQTNSALGFTLVRTSPPPSAQDFAIHAGDTAAIGIGTLIVQQFPPIFAPGGYSFQVDAPGATVVSASGPFAGCTTNINAPPITGYSLKYDAAGQKSITVNWFGCDQGGAPTILIKTQTQTFDILACATNCPPPPPSSGLEVFAGLMDSDDVSFVISDTKDVTAGQTLTVQIPIGGQVEISLKRKQTGGASTPVSSVFTLGTASVDQTNLGSDALFPQKVILIYNPGQAANAKRIQAVHLGNAPLTITPQDGTTPAVAISILVYAPQALNNGPGDSNQFDADVISLAHRFGILPQFIKAHISAEGRTDRLAYRYEPLNLTTGDLGVSRRANLRAQAPYSLYRLPTVGDAFDPGNCNPLPDANLRIPSTTCPGLAEGAQTSLNGQTDVDVIAGLFATPAPGRSPLRIPERDPVTGQVVTGSTGAPQTRVLTANDRYVSVQDIFTTNDQTQNWTSPRIIRNPSTRATRVAQINNSNFTAQLTLAASYGLLQVMYVTAIDWNWPGVVVNGQQVRNPRYLFDSLQNTAIGGGTLALGTILVNRHYSLLYPTEVADTQAGDYAQLRAKFPVRINNTISVWLDTETTSSMSGRASDFRPRIRQSQSYWQEATREAFALIDTSVEHRIGRDALPHQASPSSKSGR